VIDTIEKVEVWADERNLINGSTPQAQMLKLMEEAGELAGGIAKGKQDVIEDSIGDVLVVLTILCMQLDVSISGCLQSAYEEIKDRKGKMVDGVFIKEEDLT
jgi:NTP pyrophosphatase (non-canonical NTP hydrolase)